MTDYIGFKWLAKKLDILEVQPLAVESQVDKLRRTVISSIRKETYSRTVRPDPTIASHLSFALKHELVNLEFLARLFSVIDQAVLEDWIRSEPTGAYARRAGFLFEWLTGRRLEVQDTSSGNYVDALNPIEFVVASRASNIQPVRDNGGTVSNDLIRKFPHLAATSLATAVVAVVRNVFHPEAADATFVINMKRC